MLVHPRTANSTAIMVRHNARKCEATIGNGGVIADKMVPLPTAQRAKSSFMPPEMSIDTSTRIRGRAMPPGATRYFGTQVGSNFAL
jgi:hypothetical protein